MRGTHLGQRVGPLDGNRIGIDAFGQQASALVPADAELLGKVGLGPRLLSAHDVPA